MRIPRSPAPVLLALAMAACGEAPTLTEAGAGPSQVVLSPVCVEFSVPPLGASAGGPAGDLPGDQWFTENSIPVSVHRFHQPGGGTAFNLATIVNAFATFGTGQIANTNNIDLGFDFSGLSFVPRSVTFQWRDYGGYENLKVNGSAIHVGELLAAPSPLGGAAVSHVWGWGPGNAYKQGTTTLTGAVSLLGVGGQEFYIDNVCAHP